MLIDVVSCTILDYYIYYFHFISFLYLCMAVYDSILEYDSNSREMSKTMTMEAVNSRNMNGENLIIFKGGVYNVSKFGKSHPVIKNSIS